MGQRPIAFAARTLTKTEQNYSQIDKEALALVWGVKKFHLYLFGRHFTLVTDHEPPTAIFNPKKGIPAMTVARLQRYALFLAGFEYSIEYKSTSQHGNADGLSRLPLKSKFKFNLFTLFGVHITLEEIFMMYIRYKYIKKFQIMILKLCTVPKVAQAFELANVYF
jgi:hypothetical protein